MKLAVSGKGGVGKSSIAATLALLLAERGKRVLAVDADPATSLAGALGMTRDQQAAIVPISQQRKLVEERTGAKVKQYGQMFKLNPEVGDIADSHATNHRGVSLLVLGAAAEGGGGCACPENVLLRTLVTDLILFKNDALVMDMEAGVEHLGRATVKGVDVLLVVVEPGQKSIDCALRIMDMSRQIGLSRFAVIANKVQGPEDEAFIREHLPGQPIIGLIPFCREIRGADRDGVAILDQLTSELRTEFQTILTKLEELKR